MPISRKTQHKSVSKAQRSMRRSLMLATGAILMTAVVFMVGKTHQRSTFEADTDQSNASTSTASIPSISRPTTDRPTPAESAETAHASTRTLDRVASPANSELNSKIDAAKDLIDIGQADKAIKLLLEVLAADPNNTEAMFHLSIVYRMDDRRPELAAQYLEKIVQLMPHDDITIAELIGVYADMKRTEDGVAALKRAQEKNPDSSEINYGLGHILMLQGRDEESLAYLEKSLVGARQPGRVYIELADAYSVLGQSEKAIDTYQKALVYQERLLQDKMSRGEPPGDTKEELITLELSLVREYIDGGRLDEAQARITQLRERSPQNPAVSALASEIQRRRAG